MTVCRAEVASVGVDRSEQCVFGGGTSRIQTTFRNRGENSVKPSLSSRLYQVSAATLAPVGESKPFRTVTVDPNQAVIETTEVDLPAIRAEATFLLQWQSDREKLGTVLIRAFPTNLLDRMAALSTKPLAYLIQTERCVPVSPLNQFNRWPVSMISLLLRERF